MATTTNFGWETPDDTDLVKDGALAIRTLGNSIDTSLVDLKGGTTGQVLSKTSNTDMDFTWVTSDDANAIQNAIVDAKGDLIAASAADTPARLAVGNNGETLVADSSTTTGLRWTGANQANPVINGALEVWQRGTSFTDPTSTTTAMSADRWFSYRSGWATGITTTRQTASLEGFQYSIRQARNSGNTSTAQLFLGQNFETAVSIPYANKTVTLSFWAKAGANFSSGSSLLTVQLYTGTGTDQNVISGLTGAATPINTTQAITTSWVRYSFTGTVGSTATQLAPYLSWTPVGTAGANDWVEITGVQIDIGSTALPFRRSGGTLAGELAACQRYYYRVQANGTNSYATFGMAYATGATNANLVINFPSQMRQGPNSVSYGGTVKFQDYSGTQGTVTAMAINVGSSTTQVAIVENTISGATAGRIGQVAAIADATAFIALSAEL